jgi:hypothetical protein
MIDWSISKEDAEKVSQIVKKALGEGQHSDTHMNLTMDITATHLNGCPLDLDKLLSFDGFNFTHDIAGISTHIDRNTGKLRNCFLPRCAKPEGA